MDKLATGSTNQVGVNPGGGMPAVPRIRDSRRGSDAGDRERFEIYEVVSTVHGDRVARVFATATTAGGARLAAQTIRCLLGTHRLELKEEP